MNSSSGARCALLQVYYTFGSGGVERMVHNLSEALRHRGHPSHLLVIGSDLGLVEQCRFDSVRKIVPTRIAGLRSLSIAGKIMQRKKELDTETGLPCKVLVHSPGVWARLLPHSGFEFVVHSVESLRRTKESLRSRSRHMLLRWAFARHRIAAVSQGVKEDLVSVFSLPADHIRVIRNKVIVASLLDQSGEAVSTPASKYVLHVGRFDEVKQQDHLIEAARRLPADVSLVFMGHGDARLRQNLVGLAERAGLASRVVFLGHQPNPYPIIRRAACVALCSRTEAMPMVLIEALVLGVPVLSYDSPTGPREILGDRDAHSLVALNNIQELARKLAEVCAMTPAVDTGYYRAVYDLELSCGEYLQ